MKATELLYFNDTDNVYHSIQQAAEARKQTEWEASPADSCAWGLDEYDIGYRFDDLQELLTDMWRYRHQLFTMQVRVIGEDDEILRQVATGMSIQKVCNYFINTVRNGGEPRTLELRDYEKPDEEFGRTYYRLCFEETQELGFTTECYITVNK